MLVLDKISFELIPYGPAVGTPALIFYISENDEEKESELFSSIKKEIDKEGLTEAWTIALDGTQRVFLQFIGGIIEKEEHLKEWDEFYSEISRESLHIQKTLLKTPDKLRPPFVIWSGKPLHFSGKTKDFYQYFNCCYALIKDECFNPLALQEIINHQFSAVIVKNDDEFKSFVEGLRSKYKDTINHKLILVQEKNEDISKYCLQHFLKLNKI